MRWVSKRRTASGSFGCSLLRGGRRLRSDSTSCKRVSATSLNASSRLSRVASCSKLPACTAIDDETSSVLQIVVLIPCLLEIKSSLPEQLSEQRHGALISGLAQHANRLLPHGHLWMTARRAN